MTALPRRFAEAKAEVTPYIRRWQLTAAHVQTRLLLDAFPTEPEAYVLYNLVICLTDFGSGGLPYATPRLASQAAQHITGFKQTVAYGDMLRDQHIGLCRFRRDGYIAAADKLTPVIGALHAGDKNRMACLTDAEARRAAAAREFDGAYMLHSTAHQEWQALPDGEANPNWVHFNLVHWLRTSIALWGRNHTRTERVMTLLRDSQPEGAHNGLQVRIIRTPLLGLGTYDWLETHRLLMRP